MSKGQRNVSGPSIMGYVRALSQSDLTTKRTREIMDQAPDIYAKKVSTWAATISRVRLDRERDAVLAKSTKSTPDPLLLTVPSIRERAALAINQELDQILQEVKAGRDAWDRFLTP